MGCKRVRAVGGGAVGVGVRVLYLTKGVGEGPLEGEGEGLVWSLDCCWWWGWWWGWWWLVVFLCAVEAQGSNAPGPGLVPGLAPGPGLGPIITEEKGVLVVAPPPLIAGVVVV